MLVQGMRHGPDVVEHRRRNGLSKFRPAVARGSKREIEAKIVGSEAFGDALDLPLAHLDEIVGVVDAEDEFSGEEAADDGQYAILIDPARPVLDPFEIEALSALNIGSFSPPRLLAHATISDQVGRGFLAGP